MYLEPSYSSTEDHTYWVMIVVRQSEGGERICWRKWDNLPWAVRSKWNWFFTYRAARYQVQYPRANVVLKWGIKPKTDIELIQLKNKLAAKRGKITETANKIAYVEKNWVSLFPLETEPKYQEAVAKLARLREEEKLLAAEYQSKLLPDL
jgi:hypothetical protein